MGKYTNNPKAGGPAAGGDKEEDGDGGQSSHFTVGAIKMISMRQSAVYQSVFQFLEYTGCGAENQQRQKDKVKLFLLNKTATNLTQFKTIQVQAAVPERVKEGVGREQGTCSQPDPSILSRIRSKQIQSTYIPSNSLRE